MGIWQKYTHKQNNGLVTALNVLQTSENYLIYIHKIRIHIFKSINKQNILEKKDPNHNIQNSHP